MQKSEQRKARPYHVWMTRGLSLKPAYSLSLLGCSDGRQALERQDLSRAHRALVLMPEKLNWQWQGNHLHLQFELPAGRYATSVLRELLFFSQ